MHLRYTFNVILLDSIIIINWYYDEPHDRPKFDCRTLQYYYKPLSIMVVIVFGLPGSGKSYFATRLAKKLNADYVNTDIVRKSLTAKPGYSDEEKQLVYKKILDAVYEHARSRKALVIDGTFYSNDIRDNFKMLAGDLNIELKWIEIKAAEKQIKKRVAKKREFSDADIEVYRLIKEKYAPFKGYYLSLDSKEGEVELMLEKALDYLNA